MQLDSFASDAQACLAAAALAAAGDLAAVFYIGVAVQGLYGIAQHSAYQLLLDIKVSRTMLQRLEGTDRLAELHTVAHVFERHVERSFNHAQRLGTGHHAGLVDRPRKAL